MHKLLPLFSLGVGIFLLVQIVMPLISYKIWEVSVYNQNISLATPVAGKQAVLGVSVENKGEFPALISNYLRKTKAPYNEFTLSIPNLKLENIRVLVDSNDFEQHLAHLPGSALPGEKGNVFVTGHSSLPQFFRPGNFKAIFAHLPDIKRGDQIIIEAGNQTFTYVVDGLKIVDPSETWVINPPDPQGRYLSLMTCVPPGLYLKRLIVLAKLK